MSCLEQSTQGRLPNSAVGMSLMRHPCSAKLVADRITIGRAHAPLFFRGVRETRNRTHKPLPLPLRIAACIAPVRIGRRNPGWRRMRSAQALPSARGLPLRGDGAWPGPSSGQIRAGSACAQRCKASISSRTFHYPVCPYYHLTLWLGDNLRQLLAPSTGESQ